MSKFGRILHILLIAAVLASHGLALPHHHDGEAFCHPFSFFASQHQAKACHHSHNLGHHIEPGLKAPQVCNTCNMLVESLDCCLNGVPTNYTEKAILFVYSPNITPKLSLPSKLRNKSPPQA